MSLLHESATDRTTSTSATRLRLAGVSKQLGGRDIISDLDLEIASGELVCLLGPSGCGKTTTLRMIGGFIIPDDGTITIDGVDHTTTRPEKRPTAMVFQNYALWPHMTVAGNIAFGLKIHKVARTEIASRVEAVLEMVGLTHHMHSRPARISGGEQQRVALARALVLEPSLLLLDEPLSNLDAKLRVRVREEIREIQRRSGITTIFVTHDQEEALAIADRIAVMKDGRIEQFDAPDTIYRQPATPYVARFVGTMNLFEATVLPDAVEIAPGLRVPLAGPAPQGRYLVGVRPEDVELCAATESTATGEVVRDVPLGHYRELSVRIGPVDIRVFGSAGDARDGDVVGLRFSRAVTFAAEDAAEDAAGDNAAGDNTASAQEASPDA
jgi:putative spermidine/putrescine transport system ATP-binding protein